MSQFGPNGRERPNRGSGRPGLLGAGPSMNSPSLRDSLNPRPKPHQYLQDSQFEERFSNERQRRQGLLGSAPSDVLRHRDSEPSQYNRQSFSESHEYSYDSRDHYDDNRHGPSDFLNRLSPEVQQLMKNLGLSASDMKELSKLPENEISANNLARAIRDLRNRKMQESTQQHDLRNIVRSEQVVKDDFRRRSPTPEDLYDPAEPTDDHAQSRYDDDLYGGDHHPHQVDKAFSSFEQKWYSDQNPKQSGERPRDQQDASILRGSRGPVAKPPQRWPREEAQRPLPTTRKLSPRPILEPRNHPEPRRSPVPLRREPPPPPMRPRLPRSGGLLGDPHDPSTEELDLLAATITGNRKLPPPEAYRENERNAGQRSFPPPQERFQEHPPAPAMMMNPAPPSAMLEAQMKAMQVLQSEALQQQQQGPPRPREPDRSHPGKVSHSKEEAQQEAAKMRMERGRVLYIRYRCGPKNVIPENELIRLAAPFDKVTNCLIVKPKNSRTSPGWYQAFLELEQYDGAAAMLEYYMIHTPSVRGIFLQVQRSNYPNLKLREQMGQQNKLKRGRAFSRSPDRTKQKRSPNRRRSQESNRKSPRSASKETGKGKSKNRENTNKKPKLANEKKKEEPRPSQEKSKTKKQSPVKKEEDKNKAKSKDTKDKVEEKAKDKSKKVEDKKAKSAKTLEGGGTSAADGGYMLVDEVGEESEEKSANLDQNSEKMESKVKQEIEDKKEPGESSDEKVNGESTDTEDKESKSVVNEEENSENIEEVDSNQNKLTYVRENIQQASNMAEALKKIVQQNSTQAIISDILDYLAKSVTILEEVKL